MIQIQRIAGDRSFSACDRSKLSETYSVQGILRHQLLFDPRVPYTAKNSCATIILSTKTIPNLEVVFGQVKALMLADFQPGSDPGLCVAIQIPQAVFDFGKTAQTDFVKQATTHQLAMDHNILLEGLGGRQDGVIGALSAVGLAFSGNDGRYIQAGNIRDLSGIHPVSDILAAGVVEVRSLLVFIPGV